MAFPGFDYESFCSPIVERSCTGDQDMASMTPYADRLKLRGTVRSMEINQKISDGSKFQPPPEVEIEFEPGFEVMQRDVIGTYPEGMSGQELADRLEKNMQRADPFIIAIEDIKAGDVIECELREGKWKMIRKMKQEPAIQINLPDIKNVHNGTEFSFQLPLPDFDISEPYLNADGSIPIELDPETEKLLKEKPQVWINEEVTGFWGWTNVRVGVLDIDVHHCFPFFTWRRDRTIRRYFSNLAARLSYQEPEKEDPPDLKAALERCRRDYSRDQILIARVERQKNNPLLKAAAAT